MEGGEHWGSSGELTLRTDTNQNISKCEQLVWCYRSVQLDANPGCKFLSSVPSGSGSLSQTLPTCDLDPLLKPLQCLSQHLEDDVEMHYYATHMISWSSPCQPLWSSSKPVPHIARKFEVPTCALLLPRLGLLHRLFPFLGTRVPSFIWRTLTHPSEHFLRKAYSDCQRSVLAVPCT